MLNNIKSCAILFAQLCICATFFAVPSYAVQNPHSGTFAFHDGPAVCFNSKDSTNCGSTSGDFDGGAALIPGGTCSGVYAGLDGIPHNTSATRARMLDTAGVSTGVVSSLTFHPAGVSGPFQTGNFCLYQDGVGGYWSIEPAALSKGTDNGISVCSPTNTFSPTNGCSVTKKQTSSSSVEGTQQAINDFMQNRANHIYNNQPSMTRFFTGDNTTGGGPLGALAFNGSTSDLSLAFSTSRSRILARAGQPANASNAQKRIDQAFGTSERISSNSPHILSFADNTSATNQPGVQSDKQVAVSAYGSSTNSTGSWDVWTQVYGARSIAGDSKSTLWVGYAGGHVFVSPDLMVGAMGQMDWADESNSTTNTDADGFGWMIGPYIAGRIPGKNVFYEARVSWGQSDNNISPIGTYKDSFETERWMAYGKISGAYEVGKITIKPEASQGSVLGNKDIRARFNAGISATNAMGWIFNASGYHDGLGINDYHSYGGTLKLTVPLN